jgi:hypothetical protein
MESSSSRMDALAKQLKIIIVFEEGEERFKTTIPDWKNNMEIDKNTAENR